MADRRYVTLVGATAGKIRIAKFEGRDHVVVPIVALIGDEVVWPANAPGPEFVPMATLSRAANGWAGRPAVGDHPRIGDVFVSANRPEVAERCVFGRVANSRLEGKQLHMEVWLDPVKAAQVGPEALDVIARARAEEPIEVSVGAYCDVEAATGTAPNGKQYVGIWRDLLSDHIAFLPRGARGACSNAMGCGLLRAASAFHIVTAEGLTLAEEPEAPATGQLPTTSSDQGQPLRAAYSPDQERDDHGRFGPGGGGSGGESGGSGPHGTAIMGHLETAMGVSFPRDASKTIDGKTSYVKGGVPKAKRAEIDKALTGNGFARHDGRSSSEKVYSHGNGDVARVKTQGSDYLLVEYITSSIKGLEESKMTDDKKRSLRERLRAMFHGGGNPLELLRFRPAEDYQMGPSDQELRLKLENALFANEPGFMGIDGVYGEQVIYGCAPDQMQITCYRRSFSVDHSGSVILGTDREEVEPVTVYRPVNAEASEESILRELLVAAGRRHSQSDMTMIQTVHDHAVSLGASCAPMTASENANVETDDGQGAVLSAEEIEMKTLAERVTALIDNPRSPFTKCDEKNLLAFTEDRINALSAAYEETVVEEKPVVEAPAGTVILPVEEVAALRAMAAREQAREAVRKTELVTALTGKQDGYTAEELKLLSVSELERVAKLVKLPRVASFEGRVLPTLDADEGKVPPPPSMESVIRASRGMDAKT